GIPAEAYREEWDRAGKEASLAGTRMHENCERQMLGRFREMHTPRDEEERIEFRAAWQEVEKIRENRFPGVEPEKLVFSPRFFVAGSIDLLIRKAPKCYLLLDWKKVKELSYRSFDGKKGIHPATENLFDCNFIHYSLQLSIYEQILRLEHYIEPDARVEKFLNVYRKEGRFDHLQCLDLPYEALLLMAWNISNENLSPIPF
ncbi:MAG: hypothetical protein J6A21_02990, partial [Lentisphaeria bacterium]|nr:hypothetical protein [Lentisphaeria bacterium]